MDQNLLIILVAGLGFAALKYFFESRKLWNDNDQFEKSLAVAQDDGIEKQYQLRIAFEKSQEQERRIEALMETNEKLIERLGDHELIARLQRQHKNNEEDNAYRQELEDRKLKNSNPDESFMKAPEQPPRQGKARFLKLPDALWIESEANDDD